MNKIIKLLKLAKELYEKGDNDAALKLLKEALNHYLNLRESYAECKEILGGEFTQHPIHENWVRNLHDFTKFYSSNTSLVPQSKKEGSLTEQIKKLSDTLTAKSKKLRKLKENIDKVF